MIADRQEFKIIKPGHKLKFLLIILLKLTIVIAAVTSLEVRAQEEITFATKWGSEGTGEGQFRHPHGLAIDPSGNVYVTVRDNTEVQKFTSDGLFITKWGSNGTDDGEFRDPHAIDIDSLGNVYVSDAMNLNIQKFTSDGEFITKWGSSGTSDGEFIHPQGIAID